MLFDSAMICGDDQDGIDWDAMRMEVVVLVLEDRIWYGLKKHYCCFSEIVSRLPGLLHHKL